MYIVVSVFNVHTSYKVYTVYVQLYFLTTILRHLQFYYVLLFATVDLVWHSCILKD